MAVVEPVFTRKITVVEVFVSRGKKYNVWSAATEIASLRTGGGSDKAGRFHEVSGRHDAGEVHGCNVAYCLYAHILLIGTVEQILVHLGVRADICLAVVDDDKPVRGERERIVGSLG